MSGAILIVEDNPDHILLAKRVLKKAFPDYQVDTAFNIEAATEKLNSNSYGIVVSDYRLPDGSALDVVRKVKESDALTPVIVATSAGSEKIAVSLMREGASDYIVKDASFDDALPIVAERALRHADDLRERQRLEQEIRLSEARYRILVQTIPDIIYELDAEGNFIFVSTAIEQLGLRPGELIGKSFVDIVFNEDLELGKKIVNFEEKYVPTEGKSLNFQSSGKYARTKNIELRLKRNNVDETELPYGFFEVHSSANLGRGDKPILLGSIGVMRDITKKKFSEDELRSKHEELKRTQQKLVQSEKLASLGQLSAGVAHEINNPLCFITSNLFVLKEYESKLYDLLKDVSELKKKLLSDDQDAVRQEAGLIAKDLSDDDIDFFLTDYGSLISDVNNGVERIRKIVQDLRVFCSTDYAKDYANVNDIFEGIISIVWNQIRYKAELVKDYGEVPPILCNNQKVGQVFINMIINAAQAIDEKGTIAIRTYFADNKVYAEISDTGRGIPEAVLDKVFDPFFTTKKVGDGTGLGLSVSYDIIKQHAGDIEIESVVGQGTVFKISFPPIEESDLATDGSMTNQIDIV